MKQINILGITLKDYTLRESLKLMNGYLYNGALNTIFYISTQSLVEALENSEQREWLESMDLTICGEADILRAANISIRSRINEVEDDSFFTECLRKICKSKKKVYLISNTPEGIESLKTEIENTQSNIKIVGSYAIEDISNGVDILINDINCVVPNVIISSMPNAMQEQLIFENKLRINANVWLALLEKKVGNRKKRIGIYSLSEIFYKRIFNKRVSHYKKKRSK